jgi:hypothetical protein
MIKLLLLACIFHISDPFAFLDDNAEAVRRMMMANFRIFLEWAL